MKREISIFLILFILLVVVGCVQRNFEQPKTGDEVLSQIVPVAIKVDSITNETLDELRAQGLVISDTEQSKTYGNVIFGTINQSKVGDLGKNVQEGVTEKEYKKEVLTEIAKESGEHWVESPREFGFMVDSQIAADERKKELGSYYVVQHDHSYYEHLLKNLDRDWYVNFKPLYYPKRGIMPPLIQDILTKEQIKEESK